MICHSPQKKIMFDEALPNSFVLRGDSMLIYEVTYLHSLNIQSHDMYKVYPKVSWRNIFSESQYA
jgi:hypothetical protein